MFVSVTVWADYLVSRCLRVFVSKRTVILPRARWPSVQGSADTWPAGPHRLQAVCCWRCYTGCPFHAVLTVVTWIHTGLSDACLSVVEAPHWDILGGGIGIASISQRANLGHRHKGIWPLDQNPGLRSRVLQPLAALAHPPSPPQSSGEEPGSPPPPPPGAKRYPKSPGALVSLCSCPAGKGCPGMFSEPSAFVPQSLGQYLRIPGVPLVTKSLPSSRQTVLRAEMSHCSLLFREEPSPFGSVSGWSSPGHQASLGLGGCALPLQRWGD